jgi:hypothetical protein
VDDCHAPADARELDADRDAYLREIAAQRTPVLGQPWAAALGHLPQSDAATRSAMGLMALVFTVSVLVRMLLSL